MDADLDTLATELYVRVDDWLKMLPDQAPARPAVGIAPQITDAELVTHDRRTVRIEYTVEQP